MSSINAGNITKGSFIIYKGVPHYVTKTEFMSPGKGSPIMRVKMKNVQTGAPSEFTYKSNESVETADVSKKDMLFLYSDTGGATFMDPRTYDQISIPLKLLENKINFLVPNQKCVVLLFDNNAIGVEIPPNVVLTVTEAHDAIAGNRVNAPKKPVKLETGIEIQAPIFIKTGDRVSVDTTTGEYLARVN